MFSCQAADWLSRPPVDKLNIQPVLNLNTTQFIFVIPSDSAWDGQINVWRADSWDPRVRAMSLMCKVLIAVINALLQMPQ